MHVFCWCCLFSFHRCFADEHATEETPPPTKKYVEFTLSGTYTDTKTVSTFSTSTTKTLRGLFKKLDILKADDEIAGVIFKIDGVSVGWANASRDPHETSRIPRDRERNNQLSGKRR